MLIVLSLSLSAIIIEALILQAYQRGSAPFPLLVPASANCQCLSVHWSVANVRVVEWQCCVMCLLHRWHFTRSGEQCQQHYQHICMNERVVSD